MSKIVMVMIAAGQHIAKYGFKLKDELEFPDELEIITTHLEDAVKVAQGLINKNVDVIISRGTTANMMREAGIPIPIVEIPVGNSEIIEAIKAAKMKIKNENPVIGCIGFEDVAAAVKSFLEILNLKVFLYEVNNTRDIEEKILQAKRDNVDVLIGGAKTCNLIQKAGMDYVLLESSLASVREAYKYAKGMQTAINVEKKKIEERNTILNSVSDAIIGIDASCRVIMLNKLAENIFIRKSKELIGRHVSEIFNEAEQALINNVLLTGEKASGHITNQLNKKYAFAVNPIIVEEKNTGVIVTLFEINELQKIETSIRKGLHQKGNVAKYQFEDIKGSSKDIKEAIGVARSFSKLESNVLIVGESGTGKELFAQSIHNESSRKDGPFVAVNCGAIPSALVESELFGYAEGAFTGAKKGGKMGLFELAHGGTIFLDEISEMDLLGQVILLRAIQERQIRRVGGDSIIPVNVRVIAACNTNLYEMVIQNKFRKDLYYRLSVLIVNVPPLNRRSGDIANLAQFFVEYYSKQFNKKISLSQNALDELEKFGWDGNVRHLRNFCERIAAIAETPVLDSGFIQRQLNNSIWADQEADKKKDYKPMIFSVEATPGADKIFIISKKAFTPADLQNLINKHHGNRTLAAADLGISRTTLWKYLKLAEID